MRKIRLEPRMIDEHVTDQSDDAARRAYWTARMDEALDALTYKD